MKNIVYVSLLFFALSLPVWGQEHDLELGGGYQHATEDQGLDGYNVSFGWNPIANFGLFASYDGLYDHSTVGTFALTKIGQTSVHSHLQNLLFGPRIFLPGAFKKYSSLRGHVFVPFFEAGFGESRLHTELTQQNTGNVQSADTAFTWMLGGGVDLRAYPHFTVRPNIDFLRTHFADQGQSRLRFGISVLWSLQSRSH